MAQVIDITGSKKNFNTTVVGASVTVIAQYNVRTAEQQTKFYYTNSRVYEFNNRPVYKKNVNSFITPLVIATPSARPLLYGTSTNNAVLVTGQAVKRAGTSTQVNSVNTATNLFVTGSTPIRIPVNMLTGGVGTVNTFTAVLGQPNIYGVASAGTGTWAFAIEQLPSSQTSGLSVNSIITVNTSSGNTGNFGSGNTAYVQAINSNQIIVVASGGTTPVNGTINGITATGGTATLSQTGYTVHIFTSNGNFVSTSTVVADVLIVGGGGAGGFGHGGGGGGGAVIYGTSKSITSGTYAVVIGQGGAQSTSNASNNTGGLSSFLGISATGGGAGANEPGDDTSGRSGAGAPGANGGGGGYGGVAGGTGNTPPAVGYTVYAGNAGAAGYSVANFNYGMGGGGGAGGTPTQPSILQGGNGGNGVQIGAITDGVNNYYWGGGGGGTTYGNSNGGAGGSGGLGGGGGSTVFGAGAPYPTAGLGGGSAYNSGAAGSVTNDGTGGAAGANTGGGGGGGANENGIGGAGGSGIVVVRYAGSQNATGGTISSVSSAAIAIPTFRDPIPTGWVFTINLPSVIGYNINDVISYVPRNGRLGDVSSLVYLTNINSATNSITGISFGNTAPLLGNINAIYSTGESLKDVVISGVSASSPYTFIVSGLKNTTNLIAGSPASVITATNVTGSFGAGNTVVVQSILGYTSLVAAVASGSGVPTPGVVANFTATGATLTPPQTGQQAFTATGTFSWVAPAGVTSVNVVAVGGGGGGGYVWSSGGGGGGGLGWKNNIAVTPGNSYTVVVGAAGPSTANATNAGAAGGTSYFISTGTVAGYGGGQGGPNSTAASGGYGGGYFGDAGGRGGNGAYQGSWNVGGAGAGGYSGNGADNNGGTAGTAAPTGSGAGGTGGYYSSTYGVPAGGGVGILGRGADGTAGGQYYGGGGGSGGQQGCGGEGSGQSSSQGIYGGAYGGGGGGSGTSYGGGPGGRGAVRIIWGAGRSFPVTLTADQGSTTAVSVTTSFKNQNIGGPSVLYPTNGIGANPKVYQQNVVPKIIPILIDDRRRLVLQRTTIQKTGYGSLRYNTVVEVALATTSQYFSTGTLAWPMPLTSYPGGLGYIGTVTAVASSLPNIYGVAVASTSNWAFAIENLPSSQISSLSYGSVVTASGVVGNFGTGNTVWVYSTATTGYVVFIATGGTVAPTNGTINSITVTGQTYIPALNTNVDLLVVGGGGSGGNSNTTNANGGGGGGGVLYATNLNISTGTYAVVIGQGGAAVGNATIGMGNRGGNTSFGPTYIAQGGGGGGSTAVTPLAANMAGGSGGGAALSQTTAINTATQTSIGGATGYGFAGGGSGVGYTGAGGGGAGGTGVAGSASAPGGDGGQGRAFDISGSVVYYAGGGGGGGNSSERAGDGYAGGGRGEGTTTQYAYNSYPAQSVNAVTTGSSTPNAIPNTGGGGGGGSYWASNGGWGSGSGQGGSGIVIVRYKGAQTGGGGTITSTSGYTVHTFTVDGTFAFNGTTGLSIPTFRAPVQNPWSFAITGTTVVGFNTNTVISAQPFGGTFGPTNTVYIDSINTTTNTLNCIAWANASYSTPPISGRITAIYPTGAINSNPTITSISTGSSGWQTIITNIKGTNALAATYNFTATSITGSLGTGTTATVVTVDSFTQITAQISGGTPTLGFIGTPTFTGSTSSVPVTGDIAYFTTGTFTWVAPTGVTSVNVVAVGGGGGGGYQWSSGGGGGGGLGWKNNIPVTPGNSYTVVVGGRGVSNANATTAGSEGGNSYFINLTTVAGYGGGQGGANATATGNGYGGGYVGDGGGRGGNGAYQGSWTSAGAGAGGYSGNGADSGSSGGSAPASGSGGGAAGGYYSSTYGVPAGGGVGVYGKGADGVARGQYYGGGGGSGGGNGVGGEGSGESSYRGITGGNHGGGGGGSGTSYGGGFGGVGAVRIIWGQGRAFPATNAGTLTTVSAVVGLSDPTSYDDNIGGDPTARKRLANISTPFAKIQNTVPIQVLVNTNSLFRPTVKTYIHVPTDITNSTDYEMAPSDTRVINPASTLTNIYGVTTITSSSWGFRIYNLTSATVSGLSVGTIITVTTSSGRTGNFGVGNTVSVFSITNTTGIIAIAQGGSSAPVAGSIDTIAVPGGTSFYTPPTLTADILIVGGGGSGGNHNTTNGNGGGGGGGVLYGTGITLSGVYNLTVGAGGAAIPNSTNSNGNKGTSSTFGIYVAHGGGGGNGSGAAANSAVQNGGSGGGLANPNGGGSSYGTSIQTSYTSPTVTGYGNSGGTSAIGWTGGGGGGAGSAGVAGSNGATGGDGGQGRAFNISGSVVYYAGGGGGGGNSSERAGDGYAGGGRGTGSTTYYSYSNYPAQGTVNAATTGSATPNAIPNTGGGGGGGSYWAANGGWTSGSGSGGSGIVIVRYAGSQQASGGTVTSVGGNTIHTFTSVGAAIFSSGFSVSQIPDKQIQGVQAAFVAVVPVSSATSYSKNRSFTARLQSPSSLPNVLGTIKNINPSPVSGSSATIYSTTPLTTNTWALGIYNVSSATVSSLTYGTIITVTPGAGNTGTGNTVYFYTATNSTSIVAVVTGGTVAPIDGYTNGITVAGGTYTPTSSPASPTTFEYFIVGGGGGSNAGGGGAGGISTGTSSVTAEYRYNLQAGAGGAAGQQGFGSSFEQVTVPGGGFGGGTYYGGTAYSNAGGSGASGGGGGSPGSPSYQFQQGGASGGARTLGQGYGGGSGGWWAGSNTSGGGGGGFTSAGGNGSGVDQNGAGYGGSGGSGFSSNFSGVTVTYAQGGGGWGFVASGTPSTAGALGTGNGGGGLGNRGGSGIAMIRYPDSYAPAWAVTGNPKVTVTGGYRIYSWINTTTNTTVAGTIQFAGPSGYVVPNLGVPGAPGPWTFILSNMNTTAEFSSGTVITSNALTGSFGANNTVRVLSVTSATEMVCIARSGDIAPTVGNVTYIQPTGAIEFGPLISNVTTSSASTWTFTLSNLTATNKMQLGSVIVATTSSNSTGSIGTGTVYVTSIVNITQVNCIATGGSAPVAGFVETINTSGAVVTIATASYVTMTYTVGGPITVTNNGTTDVNMFKTSSANSWDSQVYSTVGFTAPCTIEFYKQAGATDNSASYAMIGWNADPTTDASYSSLDWAAYPYQYNSYSVHHNGTEIQTGPAWDPAKKFYIVYTGDGYIKHYNGSTLLFSVFKGTGQTVYFDSSFYSVNATYGGFSNVRLINAEWNGAVYSASANYSIVRTTPNTGRQDDFKNIAATVAVSTLNRPVNYFGNETTDPKLVISTYSTTSMRNVVLPMFEVGVNPGTISNITTVTTSTWSFTIGSMRSTSGFTTGTIINATAVVGSFGIGNQVTVTGVTSSTQMNCITSFGSKIPLAGNIIGIYATGEIEPTGPYIERVFGTTQLANTTSYSVFFSLANSSYLQYPNSTQFNLATAGAAWTAECWIKPDGDYSVYRTIFCKRVTSSGTTSYEGYLRLSSGVISFYNGTTYESSYTPTANVWSHCAWVYTGSTLNIYVNGVVQYSVSISLGADNTEPLVIGAARGYSEYFNGYISNFRLVKNLAVYTGAFTPPTSPLATTQTASTNIAAISTNTYTSLLVCQTNTFTDRSIYNTATTIVGTPSTSIDNPFGTTSTITGPWSYTISGLTATNAFVGGSIVTATSVVGNLGTGTSYVNYVINNRQLAVINNTVNTTVIPGAITAVTTAGSVVSTGAPAAVYQVAFNTSPPTSGGSGIYLTTPSTANYNLGAGGDFTVECWIYVTSNGNNTILTLGSGGSATFWLWQVNSDRSLTWQTNSGSWAWANTYTTPASQIPLNSWTHIAAVRSGSNFTMYINGSSAFSTASFNAGTGASGTLYVGTYYANYNNDGSYFRGNISNLRIVRGTAVYSGNFGVPTAEPGNITNTVLLICRSSTFIDNSTNAVTITPVNTPVISLGTLLLSPSLGAFPASNYTATIVFPELMGSRVVVQGKTSGTSITYKSFDTETITGVFQRTGSTGTAYGNKANWSTFTVNSPYVEGKLTRSETLVPFLTYTRDVNTTYAKTRWVIPEPMNLVRGGWQSTATVVVATAVTSTYVRSTSTGSINAFTITPTTRVTRTPLLVTNDPNGVVTVGTVFGSGPWTFDITGLTSLTGFTTGTVVSSIGRVGNAGAPGTPANVTYVVAINTNTMSITCASYGTIQPVSGIINSLYPTGESMPDTKITAITTITGSSWYFNITGLRGTTGLVASAGSGTVITITTTSGSTGTVGAVGGNSLVVTSVDSTDQIKVYAYGGTTPFAGTITTITTSSSLGSYPFAGDAEFTTPGTYTWIVPTGVTSVSAVAIGGGGAGYNSWSNAAGAGAGLGWKNNITVVPGNSYTVVVGAGGVKNGGAGGNSYFINLTTVAGYGGGNASSGANTSGPNANGYGGGYVGDGGGAGGNATNYAGGGGAGGYSGTGGNAQSLPASGSGGAAGGGYYSSTYGTGAGGGTGIYGKGDTATGWWHGSSGQVFSTSAGNGGGGQGGSGGTRGLSGENPTNSVGESGNVDGYGGTYGGGGGGPGTSWPAASGSGGKGAVRIIYGSGRAFPATSTGSVITVVIVNTLSIRSSLIGGPIVNWKQPGTVITNYIKYPKSVQIDRPDQIVVANFIAKDAVQIKSFYTNSGTAGGGKSITNSLIGSENFYVDGTTTGTNLTSQTAYWI